MKTIISASVLGLGLLASQGVFAATSPVLTQTGFSASDNNVAGNYWEGDDQNDDMLFEYFRFDKSAVASVDHFYSFDVDTTSDVDSEVTFTLKNLVTTTGVFIDNTAINLVQNEDGRYASTMLLSAGSHVLKIMGIEAAQGGHYDVTLSATAATPVPAAVWLFGSGLAGLVASRRQKSQLTA